MSIAPMYPQKTWECDVCGSTNPGDLGHCTRCDGGKEGVGGADSRSESSVSTGPSKTQPVEGALQRDDTRPSGGLDHGAIPYFPVWHVEQHLMEQDQPPFQLHDGYLPCKDKYPHHKRGVRP
jgi:hypothetical protein